MTASSYDQSLSRLLKHEGGYSNHPNDPGGPTNFGITIFDYRKYVKPNAMASDVRAMKLSEAKAIYKAKYWDAQRCDELPAGIDYSVFDYGVNSGIGRSGKVLRRILGLTDATHLVTDEVLRAVRKRKPNDLILAINDERLSFLRRLRTWATFGAGWGTRVREVKAFSLQLAGGAAVAPQPTLTAGKATAAKPNAKKVAAGTVAAGVATGGSLHEWTQAYPSIVVMCVVAIIAIGVLVFAYLKRKADEQQEAPTPNIPVLPEVQQP